MSINKSNALTQKIKHSLTAVEQKLLDMVINKVDSKSKDFKSKEMIIDLATFAEGYTNFKHLKKVLNLMPKKILRFIENDIKELEVDEKRKIKKMIDLKKLTLKEILEFTEIPEIDLIFYLETLELSKEQKKELEELKDKNKENIEKYDKKYKIIPLFASVVFLDSSNFVKIEISKELMPYLINYKNKYTTLNAKDILKLRSKYSIRLYELISSYQSLPKKKNTEYIEVSIPYLKLKEMLNLENKYKKRFDHFKLRVLNTAQKELKEKNTDIQFDYYINGRGDYKYIIFKIYNIKEMQEQEAEKKKQELLSSGDNIDQQIYTDIEKTLEKMGFNEKERNQLISNYDEMKLRRNINYTLAADKNKKIKKHIKAFLRSALEKDYAMNNYEQKQEYQQNKKKNQLEPLPILTDETVTTLEKQKESLKKDPNLYQEFIKFMAQIAKDKPTGRASTILPQIMLDVNSIETIPFIDKFIDKFFQMRE